MLELPESAVMAKQLEKSVKGRTITRAVAAQSPHGFAWYHGDPKGYGALLSGQTVVGARASGGYVELLTDGAQVIFGDGVNIRLHADRNSLPAKHQLLLELDDGGAIVCTVQMYGAMFASRPGEFETKYYAAAVAKPSPLAKGFTQKYFLTLTSGVEDKISVKAFLATEQRIPGLGNGCLQDILFHARLNPQTRLRFLDGNDFKRLYKSVTIVLGDMAAKGGRDTEKDLHGNPGGYRTVMSNKTVAQPCPGCGGTIVKKAYLGGNVYFCPACQPAMTK